MEQIVLLLRNGGDPNSLDNTKMNNYDESTGQGKVWPEQRVRLGPLDAEDNFNMSPKMSLADFDSIPAPRTLKTHAPRAMFLE